MLGFLLRQLTLEGLYGYKQIKIGKKSKKKLSIDLEKKAN